MSKEPVAWMYEWEEEDGKEWTSVKNGKYPPIVEEEYHMRNLRPLYTSPIKSLSDDKLLKISLSVGIKLGFEHIGIEELKKITVLLAREIEDAHGIGDRDDSAV